MIMDGMYNQVPLEGSKHSHSIWNCHWSFVAKNVRASVIQKKDLFHQMLYLHAQKYLSIEYPSQNYNTRNCWTDTSNSKFVCTHFLPHGPSMLN